MFCVRAATVHVGKPPVIPTRRSMALLLAPWVVVARLAGGATPAAAEDASRTPPAELPSETGTLQLFLDRADAIGPVDHAPGGPIQVVTTSIVAGDTVPSRSRYEFRWHAEPPDQVGGYRYGFDEPTSELDASVEGIDFDRLDPGPKAFVLEVLDASGEPRDQVTLNFQVNHAPDTWFAGPDPALFDARFGLTGRERRIDIPDWGSLPDFSGLVLSCDSLARRPAERAQHRTFFEFYGNRLWVRSEFDTVHANAWLVFEGGGFDPDSPYDIVVGPGEPALEDTAACAPFAPPWVVRPDTLVGSPVGFRIEHTTYLSPGGDAS